MTPPPSHTTLTSASTTTMSSSSTAPPLFFQEQATLPVAQLESLRAKINQMVDSMQTLQHTIELGGQNVMPAWPDILSKYTMLLSQSHNLSMSLVGYAAMASGRVNGAASTSAPRNPYESLALHPSVPMSDTQLDNEIIPLLRNQQTNDVLKLENDTVKHLAEHMTTRGSLGVLAPQPSSGPLRRLGAKVEYSHVLQECEQIRLEHDERVDRAVRAVALLREKYDWKARVEVDQEEPEELDWDPLFGTQPSMDSINADGMEAESAGNESNDEEEEEELEEVLGHGADQTPEGTPQPQSPMNVTGS